MIVAANLLSPVKASSIHINDDDLKRKGGCGEDQDARCVVLTVLVTWQQPNKSIMLTFAHRQLTLSTTEQPKDTVISNVPGQQSTFTDATKLEPTVSKDRKNEPKLFNILLLPISSNNTDTPQSITTPDAPCLDVTSSTVEPQQDCFDLTVAKGSMDKTTTCVDDDSNDWSQTQIQHQCQESSKDEQDLEHIYEVSTNKTSFT